MLSTDNVSTNYIYIYIYIYKEDLALKNIRCSIAHKTQQDKQKKEHMYNHLTVCKQLSSGMSKNVIYKLCVYKSYIYIYIYIYIYKEYLALKNLRLLICHKSQQDKPNKRTKRKLISDLSCLYISFVLILISNQNSVNFKTVSSFIVLAGFRCYSN